MTVVVPVKVARNWFVRQAIEEQKKTEPTPIFSRMSRRIGPDILEQWPAGGPAALYSIIILIIELH